MSEDKTNNSRQAAWVAIGSFFSFIVGIVSPMVLARYFSKGDYGTYKQVMYVYSTLLSVFTLGLPKAYSYFLPKYSQQYQKDIINKITRMFFLLGTVFSLLLLLCAKPIAILLKNPDLEQALLYFSPTPFLLLPTMGLDSIFATFKKAKFLAFYTIFTRVLTIVCIVLPVVLFNGNYLSAIIGFDIASLITFFLSLFIKTWPVKNSEHKKADLSYHRIFQFSIPLVFASVWGMVINSASQFFISRYYGNEVFAEFSNGFMELPFVNMILGAIAVVLLPVFSGLDRGEGLSDNTLSIWSSALKKSAMMIFPMLVFSIFFAKPIMTCMYGDNYTQSSIYFQIKNISGLFIIIPFYPILLSIGKTKEYANIHMLIAFLIVILEYLVCKTIKSAICLVAVSELCQVLKIYLMLKVIANYGRVSVLKLLSLNELCKVLFVSLVSASMAFLLIYFAGFNKFQELIFGAISFVMIYIVVCTIFRVSYKNIISSFIDTKQLKCLSRFIN